MTENIENVEVVTEVVETPVDLTAGQMLHNARTTGRRKREIATIAKQLCIREEFLEALESGNYSIIPEQVYILGFARNYALELGLDPDEIVKKIKEEMGVSSDCAKTDEDETACAMPSIKEESWVKVWFVKVYQFIYQHWLWFLGGAVLIGAIIAIVFVLMSKDKQSVAVVNNTFAPVAAESTDGANNAVVAEGAEVASVAVDDGTPKFNAEVREVFGTDNKDESAVVLQAVQESWVKVEDGRGNTVFSRVLVPGDVYYVPKGNNYKATFGNAGGVDIWVNGKLAPDAGADHTRVSDISLKPEKLMAKK
jgi:cytoskeleton protein RodZ